MFASPFAASVCGFWSFSPRESWALVWSFLATGGRILIYLPIHLCGLVKLNKVQATCPKHKLASVIQDD